MEEGYTQLGTVLTDQRPEDSEGDGVIVVGRSKIPNRGHGLTLDHGWQEVAQTALDFVKRFVPAKPS